MKYFKTVRGKLTLTFLSVFGTMLIIFCIVIYNIQSFQYRNSMDGAIKLMAKALEDEIKNSGIVPGIFDEVNEIYIPFTISSQHYIEVEDSLGNPILKSPLLKGSTLPVIKNYNGLTEEYRFYSGNSNEPLWNKKGVRIFLYPIIFESKKYIIKAAVPLSNLQDSLSDILMIYFICIPLTLLISALAGIKLSKKIYKPVKELTSKADNISAENLSLRLPVNSNDDELALLSLTLNNMIQRIERSFVSLKQFTSDASHELRTPLTILRGQIEVNLTKKRSIDEYELILKDNLDEIIRLQTIVEKLLIINKLESGRSVLENKQININEILIDVISKISFIVKSKNIKINLKILEKDVDSFKICGDAGSLFNAFFNILENAVRYSENNSEVSCSIKNDPVSKIICVSVKDEGIGISEDKIKNIFERFYRVDSSRTRDNAINLGLGLSIAKGIIDLHKGRITVESKEGKGSVFNIILPYL
ncbi:ATP-binding protein [soil metagenome]